MFFLWCPIPDLLPQRPSSSSSFFLFPHPLFIFIFFSASSALSAPSAFSLDLLLSSSFFLFPHLPLLPLLCALCEILATSAYSLDLHAGIVTTARALIFEAASTLSVPIERLGDPATSAPSIVAIAAGVVGGLMLRGLASSISSPITSDRTLMALVVHPASRSSSIRTAMGSTVPMDRRSILSRCPDRERSSVPSSMVLVIVVLLTLTAPPPPMPHRRPHPRSC